MFLDLIKAFDIVDHGLLENCNVYEVRDKHFDLSRSYLSNRYQFVEMGGIQSKVRPVVFVPQGFEKKTTIKVR